MPRICSPWVHQILLYYILQLTCGQCPTAISLRFIDSGAYFKTEGWCPSAAEHRRIPGWRKRMTLTSVNSNICTVAELYQVYFFFEM